MILILLRIYWTNLSRDRVAQAMTFLLPIIFFSIFAMVFSGQGGDVTPRIRVAVVDEDHSGTSRQFVRKLQAEPSLNVKTQAMPEGAPKGTPEMPITASSAEAMVRGGSVPVAIVLPAGFDTSLARFEGGGQIVKILADKSDPIAPHMVEGLLQKTAMLAAPSRLSRNGIEHFRKYAGALTPSQQQAVDRWMPELDSLGAAAQSESGGIGATDSAFAGGLVRTQVVDVLGKKKDNGMVSFYAAGVAVMFLLFSCSSAAGALLDEIDSGTLDRVLTSNVGMTGLLAGKWVFMTLMGMLQITVMFSYAMLVFKLDLLGHFPGFAVMTFFTAATAAAFGLVLATACKTRAQLGGISTIVILSISAIGGSMFPRFLMSEAMQKAGLVAFNAWALDGYVKVFWRDAQVAELWPQVAVLAGFAVVFLTLARMMARRWESA